MRRIVINRTQIMIALMMAGSLQCSEGDDLIAEAQSGLTAAQEIAFCRSSGLNVIIGTSNNDVINGTAGADCIVALGGQDTINAGGGDDIVFGGDGDDIINGGDGNDILNGGSGQ